VENFVGVILAPIAVLFVLSVVLEWFFWMNISQLFQYRLGRFILWVLVIGAASFGMIAGILG